MTLNDPQLLEVIEKNPNKPLVQFGRNQRTRARMHFYGVGMADYLTQIKGFEKPFMHQIRVNYAISNMDLFGRMDKPKEKVFTARGSSSYWNLGPDGNGKAAYLAQNVWGGYSCKKWVEQFWGVHADDDPMGLIFIEVNDKRQAYPTYKCIDEIYDYQLTGVYVEYVIFNVSREDKLKMKLQDEAQVFRVVDDSGDYIVVVKAGQTPSDPKRIQRVEEFSYPQWFRHVPAILNGYLPNPDGEGFVSMYHKAWDLADAYLLENSIKLSHKLLHGFPKYWEYADNCIKCSGTGKHNSRECENCNGTGKDMMITPAARKFLSYPTKDTPKVDVPGGYIEPSKTYWEMVRGELAELEEKINRTIWGSKVTSKLNKGMGLSGAPNGTATATEVLDNRMPENDCLNKIADAAEMRDKFIMDHLILYTFNKPSYIDKGGCSRNYGRRYLLEEPDTLMERYMLARKDGLSPAILYGMYEQYLEAKYATDGVSFNLHRKLMKVEPFMHYTLAELQLGGATPEELRMKKWYGDWLAQQDGDYLIAQPVSVLQTSFKNFCSTKPLPVKEEEPKPVAKKKATAK